MRSGFLITAIMATSIITWNEVRNLQRMPRPEMYAYVIIVWSILAGMAELGAYEVAVALAIGIVLAMLYTHILTGKAILTRSRVPTSEL